MFSRIVRSVLPQLSHNNGNMILRSSTRASSSTEDPELDSNNVLVEHDGKNQLFRIKFHNDIPDAILEYSIPEPRVRDFHHTEVPHQLRGKGMGQRLAKEAFDYCVRYDYGMILTCSYLKKYLKDNPKEEYLSRVEKDM